MTNPKVGSIYESPPGHGREVASRNRFEFGENWSRFLRILNDDRIRQAETSLSAMLGFSLAGKSFIDVGSGSGLFSLAARRLGAQVHSFDYDPQSVSCTRELCRRYFPDDRLWTIEQGSVLDTEYLSSIGKYDVVYSWGVLHHTGAMWQALENVAWLVDDGGTLFIAIYNDQGKLSLRWRAIKCLYNRSARPVQFALVVAVCVATWWRRWLRDLLRFRPFATWRHAGQSRGMSAWFDIADWVGGYPFEVAKPEEIFDFCRQRGFILETLRTEGGNLGCNQFVFSRARAKVSTKT
jgi:2-polyprenyl-6-hydroxyphenyl methylase/3-demethylubiquinone-9 3-methyltransferase